MADQPEQWLPALATYLAFPGRGRPKALGKKFNKDSHFRRHMAALWV
jgi:hypothetical protein